MDCRPDPRLSFRQARQCSNALDRGIPGECLPASGEHVEKNPFPARHLSVDILMDFRSPRRPLPGIQDFYNRKGLLSDKGEKKKSVLVNAEVLSGVGSETKVKRIDLAVVDAFVAESNQEKAESSVRSRVSDRFWRSRNRTQCVYQLHDVVRRGINRRGYANTIAGSWARSPDRQHTVSFCQMFCDGFVRTG